MTAVQNRVHPWSNIRSTWFSPIQFFFPLAQTQERDPYTTRQCQRRRRAHEAHARDDPAVWCYPRAILTPFSPIYSYYVPIYLYTYFCMYNACLFSGEFITASATLFAGIQSRNSIDMLNVTTNIRFSSLYRSVLHYQFPSTSKVSVNKIMKNSSLCYWLKKKIDFLSSKYNPCLSNVMWVETLSLPAYWTSFHF